MRNSSALTKLSGMGQSFYLDSWSRNLMDSGEAERLIKEDGLKGASFNLSAFEKALDENPDYDETIRVLAGQGKGVEEIYRILLVADVRAACDAFRPVHQRTRGLEGWVAFDLSPHAAHDAEGLILEAHELWNAVQRPNAMLKIPSTREGLQAQAALLREGISVQATQIHSLVRYREAAEAYLAAMEGRAQAGLSLDTLCGLASFALSRMDALVDGQLEKKLERGQYVRLAHRLMGQSALAQARIAYQIYKVLFKGERFETLAALGARPQRLAWTHVTPLDAGENDLKYAESLIGAETVLFLNTRTARAFKDHGVPSPSLEERLHQADQTLDELMEAGIDPEFLASQLEQESLQKLKKPYDLVLQKIRQFLVTAA